MDFFTTSLSAYRTYKIENFRVIRYQHRPGSLSGSIPLPHSRPVKSEFVRRCGAGAGKKLVTFTETMASRPPMPSDVAFPISGHGRSSHAFGTRQPVRAAGTKSGAPPEMGAQPPSKVRAVAQHWQGGVLHNTSNTSMSRALKLISCSA